MILHLINTRPQINLDLTNWVSDSESNVVFQHDCLHVTAMMRVAIDPQQIISYCLNEWPSKWNIQENSFDEKFTFAKLATLGITSEQLYRWSAPIDIIENYQFYLNQRFSTSKEILSLARQLFYNCTSATFGPLCQYSLDGYESSHSSLKDIIHDFYSYPYRPTTLTCYTHLNCSRGWSSVCLDWRNICDGEIDCFNDEIDEKDCWQLQINECEDDEYRCQDGRCIPKTFFVEDEFPIDCVPEFRTEQENAYLSERFGKEPTFIAEDLRCLKDYWSQIPSLSRCARERAPLMLEAMFLNKPNSTSDDCWFAFRCRFEIPDRSHPRCRDICPNDECQNIIQTSCPDILFIPNIPILFGHIYLAYTKEDAVQANKWMLPPSYICYNDQLCNGIIPNRTLLSFNYTICQRPENIPIKFYTGGRRNWMNTYVKPIYEQLYKWIP